MTLNDRSRSDRAVGARPRPSRVWMAPPEHQRPLPSCGLLTAIDPELPDDIFMGNVGLLITKLTYTVTWAPAAARPMRPLARQPGYVSNTAESWQKPNRLQNKAV